MPVDEAKLNETFALVEEAENYVTQGDFPKAERLCDSVLSLPMHTELDEEQLNYITTNILAFFNQK